MPAHSLATICIRTAIKNIRGLTTVGDIEYEKVREILLRIPTAEQLHRIETESPHIKGVDVELWHKLIARDIPEWAQKNYQPKDPKKWYEVYCRYKREQDAKIRQDEEVLRQSMLGLKKQKEAHVSKMVGLDEVPKVPRDPGMRKTTQSGALIRRGNAGTSRSSGSAGASGTGARANPSNMFAKARREAKAISDRTRVYGGAASNQLVEQRQREAAARESKKRKLEPSTATSPPAKRSRPSPPPVMLEFSDDDDDEGSDDSLDELFGVNIQTTSRKPSPTGTSTSSTRSSATPKAGSPAPSATDAERTTVRHRHASPFGPKPAPRPVPTRKPSVDIFMKPKPKPQRRII